MVAQGVSRVGVLQTNHGDDLAGASVIESGAVLCVHLVETTDVFLAAVDRIENAHALLKLARVDADVGERSCDVGNHLEDQRAERRIGGVGTSHMDARIVRIHADNVWTLGWIR